MGDNGFPAGGPTARANARLIADREIKHGRSWEQYEYREQYWRLQQEAALARGDKEYAAVCGRMIQHHTEAAGRKKW